MIDNEKVKSKINLLIDDLAKSEQYRKKNGSGWHFQEEILIILMLKDILKEFEEVK